MAEKTSGLQLHESDAELILLHAACATNKPLLQAGLFSPRHILAAPWTPAKQLEFNGMAQLEPFLLQVQLVLCHKYLPVDLLARIRLWELVDQAKIMAMLIGSPCSGINWCHFLTQEEWGQSSMSRVAIQVKLNQEKLLPLPRSNNRRLKQPCFKNRVGWSLSNVLRYWPRCLRGNRETATISRASHVLEVAGSWKS